MNNFPKKLVLIGYMASGKSTIGRALAINLNYRFVDLDDYITEKEQMSISELFEVKGEVFFIKKELYYLRELLEREDQFVVSLGGGTPTLNGAMELINQLGYSIYLKATINTLFERLKPERTERPLLINISDDFLREYIAVHLFERNSFYEKSNMTITVDEKTVENVVEEITGRLKLL